MISITPIGAVPGSPSLTGTLLILLATQKLCGRRTPWLPRKALALALPSDKYERALERAKGIARFLDRLTRRRLAFLSGEPMQRVIAIVVTLLGLSFFPFEVVPFGGDIPAIALLLIGIGMASQDGLFLALGTAAAPAPAVALLTVL